MAEYSINSEGRVRHATIQSFHEQSISVMNAMASREWNKLDEDDPPNKGSVTGAIFILMNAVLGASILVLPCAFSKVGIVTAIIMEVFVATLSYVTHIVLADAVERYNGSNYQDLITRVLGSKAGLLCKSGLFLYTFGLSCATHITVGDQLEKVCQLIDHSNATTHHIYCDRRVLIPCASLVFIFPLIWIRNISSFSYASVLSVLSVFYLVGAIVTDFYTGPYEAVADEIWMPDGVTIMNIMAYLPVFTLGVQCHMTSVPLYYELYNRSVKRYSVVVLVSNCVVFLCYITAGVFGLMTFGKTVDPDVIKSYHSTDKMMTLSRGAVAISVIMSYPIFTYLGRSALEDMIVEGARKFNVGVRENSEVRRVITLCTWHALALGIALLTSSLDRVIAIVGSIAALFMLFFPGMILWSESAGGNWAYKICAVVLEFLGLFTFLWTIVYNIYLMCT